MAMKTRIKVVTFDITNTLLQFRVKPCDKYAEVAKNHGFTGTGQDIESKLLDSLKLMSKKHVNFGRGDISWVEWWKRVVHMTFKDHISKSSIDIVAKTLIEEFKTEKCWKVASGGRELVSMLGKQGFCVGVISNFDPRLIDILKNLKLYDNFDFIITSYLAGRMKPDKQIFESALTEAKEIYEKNLLPKQCLHIGDNLERDYNGARSCGWNALLVQTKPDAGVQFNLPPEHVFESLEHLQLAIQKDKIIFI